MGRDRPGRERTATGFSVLRPGRRPSCVQGVGPETAAWRHLFRQPFCGFGLICDFLDSDGFVGSVPPSDVKGLAFGQAKQGQTARNRDRNHAADQPADFVMGDDAGFGRSTVHPVGDAAVQGDYRRQNLVCEDDDSFAKLFLKNGPQRVIETEAALEHHFENGVVLRRQQAWAVWHGKVSRRPSRQRPPASNELESGSRNASPEP
jgi:hypothetical protein